MLRKTGNVSRAARAIDVSREALYEWYRVERKPGKNIVIRKKE